MDDGVEDMINSDNDALRERLADLEKKVQEQADEIMCMRSTLADVLRRVTQLEGRAPVITNDTSVNSSKVSVAVHSSNHKPFLHRQSSSVVDGSNGVSSHPSTPPPQQTRTPSSSDFKQPNHINQTQRRLSHCPSASTSSLHSDGGHSSTPTSPALSPTPSHMSVRSTLSPRHTPSTSRHISASTSNLIAMKKWSGSQELNHVGDKLNSRHVTSGSLFNLHVRPSAMTHHKHGPRETTVNTEEGTVRLYLHGKPVIIHIPTDLLQNYSLNKVSGAPLSRLKLEWVYGYRGRDCRSNLYYLPTGEVVYFIAAVVVLYNVDDQIQRHYLGHTDDIKCLAIHPNKLLIATGQVASIDRRERRPHVRIWDSVSLNTLHLIGVGEFERAISCVAFSKVDGGSLLCVVDDSPEHTMSLWEWQKTERGHKITETKSASETVLGAEFHPMDRHCLVTIGKGHIHFWDTEGGTLAKKLGLFEKHDKPKYVLCLAFTDMGELLTGDSNGNVMIWSRGANRVSRTVYNAHDGPIFSVCVMKDGTVVTGGAKDRRIVEWDTTVMRTGREAKLPDQCGGIRTLSQGKGSLLLVGTTKNCILQGTLTLNFSNIVQGHTEEVWALAIHPTQNQFMTGGYDHLIHLWDTMSHSVVWSKDLGEPAQSACFSPDGSILVVATTSGRWVVLDAATRQVYSMHADGSEAIGCIKFSPDGKFLAIGSHDNYIYIYQVADNSTKFSRIGRCAGHSSFITHVDWSEDSTYIQTTSGDYELLFWNAAVCRQVSNMSIARDIIWASQTCTLGFNVFGIWPDGADGTDINTCTKSHNCKLLATGDDFGKIKLFSFPACQPRSLHHVYGGHSSHVTSVDFLPDDTRLISVGGRDCGIMQWTVL